MTSMLKEWLQNAGGALRWIEPDGYATRAYAGGDGNWMVEPQSAASTLAQANGALGSQVLSVDVMPALLGGAAPESSDSPVAAAEAALDDAEAAERGRGVARAVEHTLGGQVDLVLRLPSPHAMLSQFSGGAAFDPSFDDLDDAAMLLANVVREFADYGFAGLMLASDVGADLAADEFEATDSVLGTVRHYRWSTFLRVDNGLEPAAAVDADFDAVLLPHRRPSALADAPGADGCRLGGGLSAEFWAGEDFSSAPAGLLYYGDAPGDVEPEKLLERVRTLP